MAYVSDWLPADQVTSAFGTLSAVNGLTFMVSPFIGAGVCHVPLSEGKPHSYWLVEASANGRPVECAMMLTHHLHVRYPSSAGRYAELQVPDMDGQPLPDRAGHGLLRDAPREQQGALPDAAWLCSLQSFAIYACT
jgi:hypothetical protein